MSDSLTQVLFKNIFKLFHMSLFASIDRFDLVFNNGRPAFQNTVPSLYIMAQLGQLIVKMKNSWRQYLGVWTSLRFARPGLYTGPAPLCWGDELLDLWPGWCGCCRATFATPHHQPTILFYGKHHSYN